MAVPTPDDPVGGGGSPGTGGGGGGGTGTGTGTVIFDVTFYKDDAASVLRVLAYAACSSNDDLQFTGFLTIDGVVSQAGTVRAIFTKTKSAMPITLPTFVSGLSAGSHRIIFSIRNMEPDSPLTVLTGSTIEITELKHPAL